METKNARVGEAQRNQQVCFGDVFWVGDQNKDGPPHPHVVVQADVFNHSRIKTVIVCAITSNLNRAKEPGNVLLEPGEADLPKHSVVVSSQIESVEKSQLGAYIGRLSNERVNQVIDALRFLQVSFLRR